MPLPKLTSARPEAKPIGMANPYTALFIDLDDTLYPNTSGLWSAIRQRMDVFMQERLDLPAEIIPELRRSYVETYGTTLRGLQVHHQVNAGDFLAYVHDLPLEVYLQPDAALAGILSSLAQPKWILTNADAAHAGRVLAFFGITGLFAGVIDIHALGYVCKPEPEAYRRALALAGQADPASCVFFDDSIRNLAPAHRLGLTTVLVGSDQPFPEADYSIGSFSDLPAVFPELWLPSPARAGRT
jgi:putative hydrolase of the HAD superfamily